MEAGAIRYPWLKDNYPIQPKPKNKPTRKAHDSC